MIDLETLSTRADAAIIQIAALAFDPASGPLDAFNVFVLDFAGRHVDPNTVAWWLQRGVVAQHIGDGMGAGSPLDAALRELAAWFVGPGEVSGVWSHGATFDLPILEHAYAQHSIRVPWHYRTPRDTRTVYALTPGGMPDVPADPERKHDAAYDCERQVQTLVAAFARIRESGAVMP